jgi:RimJ/RimL family protein N-acetyltransferase
MRAYKCLTKQKFSLNNFQIVPIRDQDRYDIMKWRNDQIYHLRQSKPLNKESQDIYFDNVISRLFQLENPEQILFSYLQNGICIGYGGLVHINWVNKNAEISFIINTDLEKKYFHKHWGIYLKLIEDLSFNNLRFHKIFVYAFDLRDKLYQVLESASYINEARLKEHIFFNENFIDVLIYSKLNADQKK